MRCLLNVNQTVTEFNSCKTLQFYYYAEVLKVANRASGSKNMSQKQFSVCVCESGYGNDTVPIQEQRANKRKYAVTVFVSSSWSSLLLLSSSSSQSSSFTLSIIRLDSSGGCRRRRTHGLYCAYAYNTNPCMHTVCQCAHCSLFNVQFRG